jgi:CSLREA domain-containing protein
MSETIKSIILVWGLLLASGVQAIVFTVDSTGNASDNNLTDALCATSSGSCTLRAAIQQANFVPGPHEINFNIPGPGIHRINVTYPDALPELKFSGIIDGTTQAGSNCATATTPSSLMIEIKGNGTVFDFPQPQFPGLIINHPDLTLKGLSIGYFTDGILIDIETNTSVTNTNFNIICNHIGITGNGEERPDFINDYGIDAKEASSVGTWRQFPDGRIGGNTPAQRNVISGLRAGVHLYILFMGFDDLDPQTLPGTVRIQGNYIGTTAQGGAGGVISEYGIYAATPDIPSSFGSEIRIGGNLEAAGNLVANNDVGIFLYYAENVNIYNNEVGKNPLGLIHQGNMGNGVEVFKSRNIDIGKNDATDGNHIHNNFGNGILVWGDAPTLQPETSIRGNSIHDNLGLGIDLGIDSGSDGVTANDAGDTDTGVNALQNYPFKLVANSTGTISGLLDTQSNETIALDFFTSDQCHSSGFGEGKTFLGTTTIVTPASGYASFNANFGVILPGKVITATATNSQGRTSEFSLCSRVAEKIFTVDTANLGPDASPGDGSCLTSNAACSLRAAIEEANALPGGPYKIHFASPFVISPATALPTITTSVIIDATANAISTCGDAASYGVVLNGAGQTSGNGLTLGVASNGSQVKGLLIAGFPGHGIHVQGSNNQVVCNHIGKTGPLAGNYSGNGLDGIHINGAGNIIGGATAELRNVIPGNTQSGIKMDLGATANRLMGNAVGLNGSLSGDMPNGLHGVELDNASDNVIGGNSLPERNILSGNTQYGIKLGNGSTGNSIRGNYIGTSADGMTALPNAKGGVLLDNAPDNTVGGTQPNYGNLVSGNAEHGVTTQNGSDNTAIRNNDIGVNKNGSPLPNGLAGVHLLSDTNTVTFNDISFNTGDGVNAGSTTLHNRIRQNSMLGNGGLGIDLDNDGVTLNDAGDADTGANNLQNFPDVAYAQPDTGLAGFTLDVTGGLDYYVDFYSSATCDATGHGEGDVHLGSHTFTAAATAAESVVASAITGFAAEDWITATATLGSGQSSTSEFSACIPAIPDHLKLQNVNLGSTNAQHRACRYITGEQNSRITAGTNAVLRAGTAMQFRDGFAVEAGATLTLEFIKPNACP